MKNNITQNQQQGQSLIEILVVLVVATMMIIALINIILSGLKNAQFAQNQTKATKLAQDTVDKIRILRDSNKNNGTLFNGSNDECFNQLWNSGSGSNFSCGGGICYYKFKTSAGEALSKIITGSTKENLDEGFTRQIQVTQTPLTNDTEIKLVVQISWTDSSGEHNSNIENILTKPNYDCI